MPPLQEGNLTITAVDIHIKINLVKSLFLKYSQYGDLMCYN